MIADYIMVNYNPNLWLAFPSHPLIDDRTKLSSNRLKNSNGLAGNDPSGPRQMMIPANPVILVVTIRQHCVAVMIQ